MTTVFIYLLILEIVTSNTRPLASFPADYLQKNLLECRIGRGPRHPVVQSCHFILKPNVSIKFPDASDSINRTSQQTVLCHTNLTHVTHLWLLPHQPPVCIHLLSAYYVADSKLSAASSLVLVAVDQKVKSTEATISGIRKEVYQFMTACWQKWNHHYQGSMLPLSSLPLVS